MRNAGGSNRICKNSTPNEKPLGYQGRVRTALAFALCVLMVDQPLFAASPVAKRGPTAGNPQARGEGRVLHALNRLTFGPRPGDVAAVEAMGLTTWFDTQLNPSKIDDSALDARLAAFPAMQLPQAELIARYPSQQMIRQMEMANRQQAGFAGRPMGPRARRMDPMNPAASMPTDPVERAIYADEMAFYKVQQAKQAEKKDTAAAGGTADAMAGDTMAANTPPAPIERRAPQAARPVHRAPEVEI